jgi:hypothetical protein
MQYLQNFEGQELTITRQPNPSAGPFPPEDGPGSGPNFSSSAPSSAPPAGTKSSTSGIGPLSSGPAGANPGSRPAATDSAGLTGPGPGTPSYQQPKTPGTPTVSSSMSIFSPEMPPGKD